MNNILKDYNKNGFVKIENFFDKLFINNVAEEVENLTDVDTYRDSSGNLRRVERVYNKGKCLKELDSVVKKKLKGLPTKKNEVLGSFDVQGISSEEPFYKMYFYEMLVRYKNGQNFLYLIFLFILKIINKLKNVLFFK